MSNTIDITVVIPLLNEQDSLKELHDWIANTMQSNSFSYEVIFIDDGSSDNSWEVIKSISKTNACVKGIRFQRNFGKFRKGIRLGPWMWHLSFDY